MTRGIVYVATGKKHIGCALMSAASVRRFHNEPIVVLVDEARSRLWRRAKELLDVDVKHVATGFDRKPQSSRVLKTQAMELVTFDRAIFLDADTFVLKPIDKLWNVVSSTKPLALTRSQWHATTRDVGLDARWKSVKIYQADFHDMLEITGPDFPHYSSSTMAWHRGPKVIRLSRRWFKEWQKFKSRDMMALARALSACQFYVIELPRRYNLRHAVRTDTVVYTGWEDRLRAVHRRHPKLLKVVKEILGAKTK